MSRRSRRAVQPKRLALPKNVVLGIRSLVENNNEGVIINMLSLEHTTTVDCIVDKLIDCMSVNNLSAEMLLARFFDEYVLGQYCSSCLNKSSKGSSAVLASRIAREWSKTNFAPINNNNKITNSYNKINRQKKNSEDASSDEEDFAAMIHRERNAPTAANKKIKMNKNVEEVEDQSDDDKDIPSNSNKTQVHKSIKSKMKKLKSKFIILKKELRKTHPTMDKQDHTIKSMMKILNWVVSTVRKETVTKELIVETNLAKVIGRICKLDSRINDDVNPKCSDIIRLANSIKRKIVKQLDENDNSGDE
eukprot:g6419.t1